MRFAPLVLLALAALVLFVGLDRVGFTDMREARDAQVTRELVAIGEFLSPVYAREAHFEKPLLAYAPDVMIHVLPPELPFRSRTARAVLGALLLLVVASIGAQHFGSRAGWSAALVLASTLALPLAVRTDGTQMLGTLLGWVGLGGLADAMFGRREGRNLRLVAAYLALAAALLVAGPLPALWPLGGLLLYVRLARPPEGARPARPLAGLILMVGLALPWYGAMIERYGATFLAHVPFFPYAVEQRGPWFAGPLLALSLLVMGFFPWSALLPEATLHAATWWRFTRRREGTPRAGSAAESTAGDASLHPDSVERERREEDVAHFFVAAMIAALAPVAIYPGPPLPAVLPALPAAALLAGRLIDHLFEDPARLARPMGRAALMLALVGSALALLLAIAAPRVGGAAPQLRLVAAVAFGTSWLPFLARLRGRLRLSAMLMMLPVALGAPIVTLRLLPAMADYLNAQAVAEAMNGASPPLAPLAQVEPELPSLRLYCRRNLVDVPGVAPRDVADLRAADGMVYVAFAPGRESEMARQAGAPLEIMLRTPTLVLARIPEP